jgi:hypothetical protein
MSRGIRLHILVVFKMPTIKTGLYFHAYMCFVGSPDDRLELSVQRPTLGWIKSSVVRRTRLVREDAVRG